MSKIKKLFISILNLPLYLIANLTPKDENIWLFGAWFGEKYADNSKYLFEYVNKNYPEIRAIWLTKNKDVYKLVQSKNYEVCYRYGIKAIYLGLKAKYSIFVQANDVDNMLFLNNDNTQQIQLWHGTPLKKIGFDTFTNHKQSNRIKSFLFPFLHDNFDLMIAMSKEDKKNFNTAFKSNIIYITGYPRNDNLFKKTKKDKFHILYLPTFRGNVGSRIDLLTDNNFDYTKYQKWLSHNNSLLDFKMHPVNQPTDNVLNKIMDYKNINFLTEVDVAEILPQIDILITDYSSVYFDYLLTDKPIIFASFDYEKYITEDRELYYIYDEVTPGPKCKNWDEVLTWIEKFKNNPALYAKERKSAKDRFHKYQDARSCERVYNKIINLG